MEASLFLKIFLSLGLTTAGLMRLMNPDIAAAEQRSLGVFNPVTEPIIAVYEIAAIPAIFYASAAVRNAYLGFYWVCIIIISLIYLRNHRLSEIPKLVAFTDDLKVIWYHILIVALMVALMLI